MVQRRKTLPDNALRAPCDLTWSVAAVILNHHSPTAWLSARAPSRGETFEVAFAFSPWGLIMESIPTQHHLRTFVYVDGFNFYYRSVKDTPYKWLNFMALFRDLLRPTNEIRKIRYFTAMISGRSDPTGPARQQVFLRALATIPEVEVHLGNFLVSRKWARLADQGSPIFRPAPELVCIRKTEEKGSDVNLASYLLRDAFTDRFDVAVVVSNDTDLVEPIRVVTTEIGKPVGLICPATNAARSLTRVATFCRFVTRTRLAAAQFPDHIPGTTIRKPEAWTTGPSS